MSPFSIPKAVTRTAIALFVLWAASFALSYVHLGAASLLVALAIAALKAALVVMFFMELVGEGLSMKLTLAAAGGLLAVLVGLMVADVATREPPPLLPPTTREAHAPPR
ncbi:MAG: cytochrome C oxidase subunit IV family protein [Labilithrix sp.]|nr:cytochrome C oxidase subunit IV family protein [Labilithrix sp.]MCW5834830.1 cytochrome C oxidase subunit IV family protein [Labilithrix sp.]